MPATAPLPEISKLTYENFRDFPADGKRHEQGNRLGFELPLTSLFEE